MVRHLQIAVVLAAVALSQATAQTLKQRPEPAPENTVQVPPGTHILLSMINSVSTKQANVGDRIYLETAFPVLAGNRIVIPQGSWVTGTITEVKRPGRVKGKGELQVSFDSITLPNGVTRNLRSDLGAIDARSDEKADRENSKVTGPGNKKGDAETIATTTATGAGLGTIAGSAAGHWGQGLGIGAGAGAAAGVIGVLLSRGPDAMLTKGSTVEMITDRPLRFSDSDLSFANVPPRAAQSDDSPSPQPQKRRGWIPGLRY